MDRYKFLNHLREDNKYILFQDNPVSKRNRKRIEVIEKNGEKKVKYIRDMEIFLFIDTCTWLNQAEKGNFHNFLKIADLAMQKDASLLIPEQLRIEWDRHKEEKVYKNQEKNIDELIKKTTSLRDRVIKDEAQKKQLTELINQALHFKEEQVKIVGGQTVALIDEIMDLGTKIPIDDKILVQAAKWGLKNVPPFAPKKNSTGDAVLFFSIMNFLENFKDPILYFITDNKDDFSESSQPPLMYQMHSHFIDYAKSKGIEIRYSIILDSALDSIIEEVTDEEYIKECEKRYQEYLKKIPKCKKCGNVKEKEYHNYDGYGRKIYYKCTVCHHVEETGNYDIDAIHDNLY